MITTTARDVLKHLNGVICVYKPVGISAHQMRAMILNNICKDLNQMDVRPPSTYVSIEGDTTKEMSVIIRDNYADDVLVAGPRYIADDFKLNWASYLGRRVGGVSLTGINAGSRLAHKIHEAKPLRTYHLKGCLGQLTDTLHSDGKVVEKASFKHINKGIIDRVSAVIQATHQRLLYSQLGVDIQSQAAYDLAVQGPIRPVNNNISIVYSLKCIYFKPPDYTLEVHCINENEDFLLNLNHELGMKMRTVTTCTSILCIRHGFLTVEDALLRKHWSLQHVLDNICHCNQIINNNKAFIYETPSTLETVTKATT